MKNVRLIKDIPAGRLRRISGDANAIPKVGDLGETDHCFNGALGSMVIAHFLSADSRTEWEAELYLTEIQPSIADRVNIDALFDVTALLSAGEVPWTILAYPSSIARRDGLPPDRDAQMLIAEFQKRGIPISVWRDGPTENTTYIACYYQDKKRIGETISELETQGILDEHFLASLAERFFADGNAHT